MSTKWTWHDTPVLYLLLSAFTVIRTSVLAADEPVSTPLDGAPSAWLSGAGRSEEWKATTLRCRQLLEKLDLQQALVQKYLPQLKAKVQLLLRSPDFDWKKETAVEYLQNMLDDLIAGQQPHTRYTGKEFGYAYWSKTMQRIEAIWVHVPPGYDSAKNYQFFIYYKSGGGIHLKDGRAAGGYRPTSDVANQTDSFHAWSSLDIQVKGRMGAHIELEEATTALRQDFSIDPDRLFLTGWSDGGFTAIWLASRYPHLVAGIAPVCGNWQYSNIENVGLLNLPTLAVDGWSDGGYNNLQFCRWLALRGSGADARCIWGHHGHSYQPYEDVEEFQSIMDWAKGQRRNLYPNKVRFATWNLAWNRAYWFSIDRVINPALAAQFEAEVIGRNTIRVEARNIAAYKLALGDKLLDSRQPITVMTDGRQSYAGPLKSELLIELAPRPEGRFVKDASLPDEITAATVESSYDKGLLAIPSRRWLSVRPTGWDERTASVLTKWLPKNSKADHEITDEDLAESSLMIYGGPEINKLTARIAAELPVKFETGKFAVGRTVYDRQSHCVAFIHPNPLNPKRYVIVYAFNDAETFAQNRFFGMTGGSLSEFRAGDCLIFGIPAERRRWGVAMDGKPFATRHLIFDNTWKADASPPLGALDEPFDYLQILRLKADAIREATGADAGVIWEHTPSWNRWGTELAAGPVTLHDLATLDMFPENVMLADMTGADLRRNPSASTVVAERREPAFDGKTHLSAAELDPSKTYRVAMGYYGLPSFGADPARMPKLFPFSTPEDFLAVKSDRIPLKNLRQLPLQVIEATAQYIQRHKKVSPRRVCFDLTHYIINPQDNDYGACDWLHVGIDTPWKGASGRRNDRYTLNLGLRRADEPDAALPRANSKHFLDLGERLTNHTNFDFATLNKQLSVTINIGAREYAVTADKEFKTFILASAETNENVVGRCVLFHMTLANAGPVDVGVTAALSAGELRAPYGQIWPDEDNKTGRGYYAGYHRSVGEYRQPPIHEDAALMLFADLVPKTTKLVTPNAGYNFGLAGLNAPLTIRAGQKLALPVFLVTLDKPAKMTLSLVEMLDSLRHDLTRGIQ